VQGTRWSRSQATPKRPQSNIPSAPTRSRRLKSPFTVSALSERTGVPLPTIHYYRRLGLLPEPTFVASNRFLYDDRHVEALGMIRLLQEERHMTLASIAEVLPELLPGGKEEAFRPGMWDQVLGAHLEYAAQSEPAARLLAAAREAFAQDGYAGVNIADICDVAGTATGSFYRHFESKEAIFVAAVRSVTEVIGQRFAGLPARMSTARASALLQEQMEPFVPLLLESAMRERRGAPELTGVTADVMHGLTECVQSHLSPIERSSSKARLAVRTALLERLECELGFDSP
jgi:AcrR family transcriptional regulator